MIFSATHKKTTKITFLVSPLDWGLGHATRCIPIIKELEALNFNIIIAAQGINKQLLQKEFPSTTFIPCPQYNVRYSHNKNQLPVKLLIQAPKIVLTILLEHIWLKKVVKKYSIKAIISDNRFGLYRRGIPSVYITHQLLIKTGNSFTEKVARKIHYWFIKRYKYCWIPDFGGIQNLGGILSHPSQLPSNLRYIGCLSRFTKLDATEKKIDLLVIISGPEPQRSIFESLIIDQAKEVNGNVMIVRGLPENSEAEKNIRAANESLPGNIKVKNHLAAMELNFAIQQSKMVVCRSGYTSVMDLVKLQQKAILIPTPGQTEQEYLARHLMEQKIFFCVSQENFQLNKSIEQAREFTYLFPSFDMEIYKKQVHEFAQSI